MTQRTTGDYGLNEEGLELVEALTPLNAWAALVDAYGRAAGRPRRAALRVSP